jgi:hydrogenase-4 component F
MGFLLVGLGLGTPVALFWTLFYTLAHAFTKASLFFSAGILHHQFESVRLDRIKDAFKLQPFASWTLILGTIAIIGTPASAIFLPKISILLQATSFSPYLLFGLLIIFLFATAAFGLFLIKMLSKRSEEGAEELKQFKAPLTMKLPIIILLVAVFALGVFFPTQLNDLLKTVVSELGMS